MQTECEKCAVHKRSLSMEPASPSLPGKPVTASSWTFQPQLVKLATIIGLLLQNLRCGLNCDWFDLVLVLVFLFWYLWVWIWIFQHLLWTCTYCGEVDRAWKSGFWGHSVDWDIVAMWGCPKNWDILWCIEIKYIQDSKPNRQVMSEQEWIESIDQNAWHKVTWVQTPLNAPINMVCWFTIISVSPFICPGLMLVIMVACPCPDPSRSSKPNPHQRDQRPKWTKKLRKTSSKMPCNGFVQTQRTGRFHKLDGSLRFLIILFILAFLSCISQQNLPKRKAKYSHVIGAFKVAG